MKIPTYEELRNSPLLTSPLEEFVVSWEPFWETDNTFSEDLQKLVDWLLEQRDEN